MASSFTTCEDRPPSVLVFALALLLVTGHDRSGCSRAVGAEVSCHRQGRELYLYGPSPDGAAGLGLVTIGGIKSGHTTVRWFPTRSGERWFCIKAELPTPEFKAPFDAVLHWEGGKQSIVKMRPDPGWVGYPSQYEFTVRVVGVSTESARAILTLYNESNRFKPAAELLKVFVNGLDVTERCRLPRGPLPADKHAYLADQRLLEVPILWSGDGSALVALEYRLLPPRYVAPIPVGSTPRTLSILLRKGLPFPVGQSGGPTIPECVCVHHGGLRPDPSLGELRRRRELCQVVAPDLPVYLRASEGLTVQDALSQTDGFDFCVVPQAVMEPTRKGMRTADSTAFMRAMRESGRRFVASLYLDELNAFDDRDFFWWLVTLVGQGSRGLVWTKGSLVDQEHWDTWLKKNGEWLERGGPFPLDIEASQSGLRVDGWVCGPDEIALFVTNQWCTNSPGQQGKPFYGISREGVTVTVHVGDSFGAAGAEWFGQDVSQMIAARSLDGGRLSIQLPAFETGGLIRLSRISSRTATTGRSSTASGLIDRGVEPVNHLFVNLGEVQRGQAVPISLVVSNRSAREQEVSITPRPFGTIAAAPAAFTRSRVAPGGSTTLKGTWIAPRGTGDACGSVWVGPVEDVSDGGYFAFVEARVVEKFESKPFSVDFGAVRNGGRAVEHDLELFWAGAPGLVAGFAIDPPDPRVSIARSGIGKLRIRLDPAQSGPLRGWLKVRLSGIGSDEFGVRLLGEVVPTVTVRPSRIVIASAQPVRRVLRIDSIDPVRVDVDPHLPTGLSLVRGSHDLGTIHRLEIQCDPARIHSGRDGNGATEVTLHCIPQSGAPMRLRVPVRWIALAGGARSPLPAGQERGGRSNDPMSVRLDRVGRLLHAVRSFPLPEDCPNWVLIHTLLLFAPASSRTPAESAEFHRRVANLLRVADASGRHGCLSIYRGKPEIHSLGRRFDRQHHPAQFLHYLAMSEVSLSTPLNVPGHQWTLADLYANSLRSFRANGDLSWVTSVICEYQPPGRPWIDTFGQSQQLGPFVRRLRGNPEPYCDESHWIMAMARIRADRRWRNDPSMAGEWTPIESIVSMRIKQLRSQQRPDRTFPIQPESLKSDPRLGLHEKDDEAAVHLMGHHLEWLTIALSSDELRDHWILSAVDRILTSIESRYPDGRYFPSLVTDEECYTAGFLAHAVSGLSRWREGVLVGAAK